MIRQSDWADAHAGGEALLKNASLLFDALFVLGYHRAVICTGVIPG
jgi:hypothetical protein